MYVCTAQVMRALPAAGLAGLLTGGHVSEGVLAERLEWCRGWTQQVAAQDADAQCRTLAAGCQTLQVCCLPVTVLTVWDTANWASRTCIAQE